MITCKTQMLPVNRKDQKQNKLKIIIVNVTSKNVHINNIVAIGFINYSYILHAQFE